MLSSSGPSPPVPNARRTASTATMTTVITAADARCLKRLWQATQDSVRAQLDILVEQACARLLETEQLSIGWDDNRGVRGP